MKTFYKVLLFSLLLLVSSVYYFRNIDIARYIVNVMEKENTPNRLNTIEKFEQDLPSSKEQISKNYGLINVDWSDPKRIQFLSDNRIMVDYVNGPLLGAAIFDLHNDNFMLVETFDNFPFSEAEWQAIKMKYSLPDYEITNYAKVYDAREGSYMWVFYSENLFLND